jgi:hypothetical protein
MEVFAMIRVDKSVLLLLPGLLIGAVGSAALAQEVVVLRGQSLTVWPNEDLRRRGFDVQDVPREENAFWTYLEAVNAFKDVPEDVQEAFEYAHSKAWPKGNDEKLRAFLQAPENQKALALARRAAAMPKFGPCYFGDPNASVMAVLLPSLAPCRQLCRLLVADGRRGEEEGAVDLAMNNYTAAMRIGSQVGGGLTLIENLVGIACWTLGDQAVREMVLRRELSPAQLREVLKTLADLYPKRPSTAPGVEREKTFGMGIVDELVTRPTQLFSALQGLDGMGGSNVQVKVNKEQDGWDRLEARLGRLVLPDRTIKKHMAGFYDQLAEQARQPAYEAAKFNEEAAVMAIPSWNVLARVLLPSLSRACTLGERCRMVSLVTRATVALRLQALDHDGQPPMRLAELHDLVPAADLVDPFSGREFAYERAGNAWMLYSFNENLTDDGGKPGEKAGDLDFVVRFPPSDVAPFEPKPKETPIASAVFTPAGS